MDIERVKKMMAKVDYFTRCVGIGMTIIVDFKLSNFRIIYQAKKGHFTQSF